MTCRSSSMVERVAAAMFAADYPRDDWKKFKPGDHAWARYTKISRAALDAMQEPTDKMIAAGLASILAADDDHQSNACWKAMLDAAAASDGELSKKQEG
jgi:hypothetical protein